MSLRTRAACVTLLVVASVAGASLPARAGRGDPWLALLAHVPDRASFRKFVMLDDYEAARDVVDIDERDAARELARLTVDAGLSPSELVQTVGRDEDALKQELGIPVASVEREIVAGEPPDSIVVLDADVERGAVERATARDDVWSDVRRTRRHAGKQYLAWDGEELHVDRVTPVRRLGRGGRLAVDPPLAVWANTDAAIEASLEASSGDERSLADDRDVQQVVDALRDAGAYSMVLTDQPPAPGADTGGPEPLVEAELFALGADFDDDTPEVLVVMLHADAADAAENAERLQAIVEDGTSATSGRPWSDVLEVDDITTDGELVVARLRADNLRLWLQVVLARDSLLATE